jgi:hypothetical protein
MLKFDEINQFEKKQRSVPYQQYFGEMDLDDEEKGKRIKVAQDLESALLFLFALILVYEERGIENAEAIIASFKSRYREELQKNVELDKQLDDYITMFSAMVVESTSRHQEDDYYLSDDRAAYIAENEANTTGNYIQYRDAVKQGKTKKEWVDKKDNRERKTHLEVGGTIIPINQPFVVGESLMMYPKDMTYNPDPDEIVNCRCVAKYF